ncbi:angiopoietin-4-like, partial [Heterocephalus glaber]|uniref:Angiopoietin-4-like n=1 Tax=Heterocephalus glaber TaxID=10181 RepID=A0AAX6SI33_HETGA
LEPIKLDLISALQERPYGKEDCTQNCEAWHPGSNPGSALEEYIQAIMGLELQQAQKNIVQKHMAPMLELGTSLLNQTTNQTLKLTDMEAQVLSQMSHIKFQMLEALLTTDKLEKQLQKQSHEPHLLHGHNRNPAVESQQQAQLASLNSLKEQLQQLLDLQNSTLTSIHHSLQAASNSSSRMEQKQRQLLENLQQLMSLGEQGPGEQVGCARQEAGEKGRSQEGALLSLQGPSGLESILGKAIPSWPSGQITTSSNNNGQNNSSKRGKSRLCLLALQVPGFAQFHPTRGAVLGFQDCEDIHRSGISVDNVYTIFVPNVKDPKRVFCVMDTDGSAWTVIQRREDGTVSFQQNWEDYKQGFGDPAGEYWLGNEVVHQLTSSKSYSLRVEMEDWDGKTFSANFEHFQLGSEEQFYRIFLDKHSGVALLQGQLILENSNFSTSDADHDNCLCECSKTMSGGWWFAACGASNLNGIYYPADQHLHKINGIRWHHTHGPTYSLRATRMMIRPLIS